MVTGPGFNSNIRFNGYTPIQQKPALNANTGINYTPANSIFQNGPTDSVNFSGKTKVQPSSSFSHNVDFNAISKLDIGNSLDHFKNPTTSQGLLFGSFNA